MEDKEINIKEAKVGEEFRGELVCLEDIPKITKMTKEELKNYSHSRLGKKLDLTRRLKMLRLDVATAVKNKLKLPQDVDESLSNDAVKAKEDDVPEFVFEPKRRRVFEYTELLGKRSDLITCWLVDKDGKRL
jgi:hypothetical protein